MYTKGKWTIEKQYKKGNLSGLAIHPCHFYYEGKVANIDEANARRICQCVNNYGALIEFGQHFFEWHANHFEDFDNETNEQLLSLANEIELLLQQAENEAENEASNG